MLLLHGFGQSSQMWRPLMRELANSHTVIAADLRGAGQSDAPPEGYAKSSMARDMHALMTGLGYHKVSLVGHDIGPEPAPHELRQDLGRVPQQGD